MHSLKMIPNKIYNISFTYFFLPFKVANISSKKKLFLGIHGGEGLIDSGTPKSKV